MHKDFKTISIGIAFSPNLRANVFEAARLAKLFSAKLILVHVGDRTPQKEEILTLILEEFPEQITNIDVVWKEGAPVEVILKTCEEYCVDLLILGALKRENLYQYYIGSIARKLTRKAQCSVLLLIKPSVHRIPCNHIVVNGLKDPKTKETVLSSFFVGTLLGANKITIVEEISQQEVHVAVEDDRSLRKATLVKERIKLRENSRVNQILEEVPKDLKPGINVHVQSIFGRRGYSIGHYAQVVRADLLIMNAPTKSGLLDRIFPHDIEYILSELPTDVLIIQ
ncbi:universal stress protein [Sungkyunkwania multivorans]|uniref:Universal stress protein n=1 Tax=Sungkyunkwania multivorans TaxID=1173618 RepID=A0ABW3CZT5_9FLAO